MRISLLVHNLSGNNLVRLYPIAKTLERFAEIEVLGFVGPQGIFPPYRNEFEYKCVPTASFPRIRRRAAELRRMITGDVLYAFKPNPLSLGVGLAERRASGRPLVLDIEDFDLAFHAMRPWTGRLKSALRIWDPQSYGWLRAADRRARQADRVTVVSSFLQSRYGGTLLPHGADTAAFDPARFDRAALKEKWGTRDFRTILFAGKVSFHKGIDLLVKLARELSATDSGPPVRLMLVGGAPGDASIEGLLAQGEGHVLHVPNQPHALMPEILCQADMVVLPQIDSLYTRAQVPGKVFEAMAMEKPIVATGVSDLPLILENAGIVVAPGDEAELAEAARRLLANPVEAGELARRARQRCIERYSWDAMEIILREVFSGFRGR